MPAKPAYVFASIILTAKIGIILTGSATTGITIAHRKTSIVTLSRSRNPSFVNCSRTMDRWGWSGSIAGWIPASMRREFVQIVRDLQPRCLINGRVGLTVTI